LKRPPDHDDRAPLPRPRLSERHPKRGAHRAAALDSGRAGPGSHCQWASPTSWKHPRRGPPSESTLQAADLVEGKRRAGPTSSVVARIYSQLEEQRVEHEHDNVEDEDRGVDAPCSPGSSDSTGWD
jgi:hypothetical protein